MQEYFSSFNLFLCLLSVYKVEIIVIRIVTYFFRYTDSVTKISAENACLNIILIE